MVKMVKREILSGVYSTCAPNTLRQSVLVEQDEIIVLIKKSILNKYGLEEKISNNEISQNIEYMEK